MLKHKINLKALRLLAPGGLLFTFSCSGAVSVDLFQKIVAGAVFDARTDMQMLRRLAGYATVADALREDFGRLERNAG